MKIKDALILAIEIIADRQEIARESYQKVGNDASFYMSQQFTDMEKCKKTLEKLLSVLDLI